MFLVLITFLFQSEYQKRKNKDHLELLLIEEGDKSHYILIADFNRFMSSYTKYKAKKHFCMYCLRCCSSKRVLEIHQKDCIVINGVQAITMPKEGSKIYSHNHQKMFPVPFVIYADFEAITEKIDSCLQNDNKCYTTTYQNHKACGFGYKVVCHYDKRFSKPLELYRGEDSIEIFIIKMFEEVEDCKRVMKEKFNKPLELTQEEEIDFQRSNKCNICERFFKPNDLVILDDGDQINKVRDHCHITGKYRGSSHRDCNLKWSLSSDKIKIPVIFHNLKGYDSHLIMQRIGKMIEEKLVYDVVLVKKDPEKDYSADNLIEVERTIDVNVI